MTSRVYRCRLLIVLLAVLGTTPLAWPATTVGTYDENGVEPNSVDFTADGSGVDYSTFQSHMVDAFNYDYGGVIDAEMLAVDWLYGTAAAKTLTVQPSPQSYYGVAAGSADCQPISHSSLWSTLGTKHVFSFDLGPITTGAPHEGVIEFGVTVLSRTAAGLPVDYGMVTGTATLSGGGMLTATRHIQEFTGQGDTFFGFVAPAGEQIRQVSVAYEATPGTTGAMCIDDLGFVTAPIVGAPTQIRWDRPYLDGQASSDDGATYTVTTDDFLLETRRTEGSPAEERGLMEFSLGDIPDGAAIQSVSLLADVWGFSYHDLPEEFPSVAVYAHGGDGALDPTDAASLGGLVGQISDISSTDPYAVALDVAAIQALLDAGHDYLTLALVQEADDLYTSFVATEGGAGSYLFVQPTLTLEYDHTDELFTGDSDLDGDVDLDDFVNLKKGYASGITWAQGDFDNNLRVDLDDFVLLKKNFAASALPEPATTVLMLAGVLPMIDRARRRRDR